MSDVINKRKKIYKSISIIQNLPQSITNKIYKYSIEQLNDELLNVFNILNLTKEETAIRQNIYQQFKTVLEKEFQILGYSITIEKFGSFMTGVMINESDIDITVLFNKDKRLNSMHPNDILKIVKKVLLINNLCVGEIIHIKKAKTPILKCISKKHNIKIDISINKKDGIEGNQFIILKLKENPEIKYLIILLKYFMKRRGLSNTQIGGLSSLSQFILILHFINLHPLTKSLSIKDNIGVLMMDFFQYYSDFDVKNIIISGTNSNYVINASNDEIFLQNPIFSELNNLSSGCKSFYFTQKIFKQNWQLMAEILKTNNTNGKLISSLWFKFNQQELEERKKIIMQYKKNI